MGLAAASPTLAFWMYCAETEDDARAGASRYIPAYYDSAMRHYELASDHFARIKGYEGYAQRSEVIKSGQYDLGRIYLQSQVWGTPEQCLEKLRHVKELTGADHLVAVTKYGGMPFEAAEASMRLFAREVLPAAQAL
jgi:alkanesulfonate monooxygenase SsuD/methylene tetrahydromethanopterin reductase-like flavin-dependent oxidoreductase (luciferase family)